MLANVCESLLRWNADLSFSPGSGDAVENPTPTTWVYAIREGVNFHDGTPLTAEDVVASLNSHLNPDVGSYWASVYRNVKSIEKTGLDIGHRDPGPARRHVEPVHGSSQGTVESEATLEKSGADYGNPSTGVNCTGPFAFDSWTSGQSITLTRYDDYWDTSLRPRRAR